MIETNQQATQPLTVANDVVILPNSLIAKIRLFNASTPCGAHGVTIVMRVDPAGAPLTAVSILETAMLGCNQILRDPKPIVTILSLDALGLECELMFFVVQYEQGPVGCLAGRLKALFGLDLPRPAVWTSSVSSSGSSRPEAPEK